MVSQVSLFILTTSSSAIEGPFMKSYWAFCESYARECRSGVPSRLMSIHGGEREARCLLLRIGTHGGFKVTSTRRAVLAYAKNVNGNLVYEVIRPHGNI